METTDIARRLGEVKSSLPQGVRLVAVSKFHPSECIKAAYDAGKICTVFKDKRYYYIKSIDAASIMFASSNGKDTLYSLTLSSADSWSTYTGQLQSKLTFDAAPTAGSNNPVTSKGIKSAIDTVNAKGLTVKEISGEQVICFE